MRLFAETLRRHAARERRRPPAAAFGSSVELLEERRVLSADQPLETHETAAIVAPLLPAAVASVSTGDSSTAASQTSAAVRGWPQPGGPGTPVTITYSYSNLLDGSLPGGLSPDQLRYAVETALRLWASVAPLNFVEVPDAGPPPSQADYPAGGLPMIRIGQEPIDGNTGNDTLALSWFPGTDGLAGDVHFDSGNLWRFGDSGPATDFFEVTLHELGHALGLQHVPSVGQGGVQSVMNPQHGRWFRNGPADGHLFAADVAQVQSIYGAGSGSVTPLPHASASPETPPPTPEPADALAAAIVLHVDPPAPPHSVPALPSLSLVTTHLHDDRPQAPPPRHEFHQRPDRRIFDSGDAIDSAAWLW